MRCAVVGSGVAGMTAALLLARRGHAVTLLEGAARPAPLLQGFRRAGLSFDTGFHCGGGLHEGGLFRNWLRALGLEEHLPTTLFPEQEEVFCFADGSRYTLPSGHAAALAAVERQFPGSGALLAPLLEEMDEALAHSPYTDPRNAATAPAFLPGGQRSVVERLAATRLPPYLAAMLAARCLLYGVPPQRAAWQEYALVAGPYFRSCHGLRGGGAALAGAFLSALERIGVVPRCGVRVTALEGDTFSGMRAAHLDDGGVVPCERCFFTGHPGQLESLLPPGVLRPAFYSHIRALPETPPGLLLFAETRSDVLDGRNMYLLSGPDPEQVFAAEHEALPSVYLAAGQPASGGDGRRAVLAVAPMSPECLPEGNPRPRPEAYLRWKGEAVARLTASIERRCPELRGAWRVLDAATGLSFRQWISGSTGSLYGVRHDADLLPLLPVTRVRGLFLAGQNILLPGVLGGIISAALAVGFAEGHENVLREFRKCADNA